MVNVDDVRATIQKLEDKPTSMQTCRDLAYLYVVLDHQKFTEPNNESDSVVTEYNDILPSYKKYCEAKRNFQLHSGTQDAVLLSLDLLCKEIKEFIATLYSNTDSQEERSKLKEYLTKSMQALI